MRKDVRQLLLKKISENGRILNEEEALDFYVAHIMRNEAGCKFSYYKNYDREKKEFKGGHVELTLYEFEMRASDWHKRAIGSLVVSGHLHIINPDQKEEPEPCNQSNQS